MWRVVQTPEQTAEGKGEEKEEREGGDGREGREGREGRIHIGTEDGKLGM